MSWGTYPFVYISENGGLAGNRATLYEQADFSLADVVARAVFGILFVTLAAEKYTVEEDGLDLSMRGVRVVLGHDPTLLCRALAHCGFV